jgi:hypothetical protein
MTEFTSDFMESMGPQVSTELASRLGIRKQTASRILPAVVPLILGGIGDLFAVKAAEQDPDPRLGGLLGDAGVNAAGAIAGKYRLDKNTVMKIIVMLAPIVLGALSRQRDRGGMGASGMAALIDQNGDGSILDDVAGIFMRGTGRSGGGGSLGGLLFDCDRADAVKRLRSSAAFITPNLGFRTARLCVKKT